MGIHFKGTQTSFPRREISSHKQVVKACDTDEFKKLCDYLLYHRFFHIVALQALPHLVHQVQDVVHAVSRLTVGIEKTVKQPSTTITGRESRK